MIFRNPLKQPNALRTIGLICLIFASAARWFLHPTASVGPDFVDAAIGLLYGLSIGFLLVSLRRNERQCPADKI
jgi:hypothetical protein